MFWRTVLACSLFIFPLRAIAQDSLFEKHPVHNIYKGKLVKPDTKTGIAHMYRTRIRETYLKEKINFAGHYCFVHWGCGSGCKGSAVVDVKTGKIYKGPDGTRSYDFNGKSRLLVLNLTDDFSMENPDCEWCKQEIWLWKEKQKKFIRLQ